MQHNKNIIVSLMLMWSLQSSCSFWQQLWDSLDVNNHVKAYVIAPCGTALGVALVTIVARRGEDTFLPLFYMILGKDYKRFVDSRNKILNDVLKTKNEIEKAEGALSQQEENIRKALYDLKRNNEYAYGKYSRKANIQNDKKDDLNYLLWREQIKENYQNPKLEHCTSYSRELPDNMQCKDLVAVALAAHDKSISLEEFKRQINILSGIQARRDETPDEYLIRPDTISDRRRIKRSVKENEDLIKLNKDIRSSYSLSKEVNDQQISDLIQNACDKSLSDNDFVKQVNNLIRSNKSR